MPVIPCNQPKYPGSKYNTRWLFFTSSVIIYRNIYQLLIQKELISLLHMEIKACFPTKMKSLTYIQIVMTHNLSFTHSKFNLLGTNSLNRLSQPFNLLVHSHCPTPRPKPIQIPIKYVQNSMSSVDNLHTVLEAISYRPLSRCVLV